MMKNGFQAKVTVFHCINVFAEGETQPVPEGIEVNLTFVKLPCSSMVKDVYILRAFESGTDAVVVLTCPKGGCRYAEGNLRAAKRVQWVKTLLDEIGLGAGRLDLYNLSAGDMGGFQTIIQEVASELASLGPNPAA
jgi:F420-non-reducing hydrogenase iron-sulfur subunit